MAKRPEETFAIPGPRYRVKTCRCFNLKRSSFIVIMSAHVSPPRDNYQNRERNQYACQEYKVQEPRNAKRHLHIDVGVFLGHHLPGDRQAQYWNEKSEQSLHGQEFSPSSSSIFISSNPSSVCPG